MLPKKHYKRLQVKSQAIYSYNLYYANIFKSLPALFPEKPGFSRIIIIMGNLYYYEDLRRYMNLQQLIIFAAFSFYKRTSSRLTGRML